jgi:hypothetical protein
VKIIIILTILIYNVLAEDNYFYQNNKKVFVKPVEIFERTLNQNKIYKTADSTLGVSKDILLKFKVLDLSILDKYGVKVKKSLGHNVYLVYVANGSVFDVANRLYNDSKIEYAHPDFIKSVKQR